MTWNLHCGDGIAGLREADAVDHVITDPPYTEHVHAKSRRVKCGGGVADRDLGFDALTLEAMDAAAAAIAYRCARWAIVFCAHDQQEDWREALARHGMVDVHRTLIWRKTNGAPQLSGDRPAFDYECAVLMHGANEPLRWNGHGQGSTFEGPIDGTHKLPKRTNTSDRHPTPKPLWLMRRWVELFTDPGETIADPFAGGATTIAAAVAEGRSAVGWEIDRKRYNIGMRRLADPGATPLEGPALELPFATSDDGHGAQGDPATFPGESPRHSETAVTEAPSSVRREAEVLDGPTPAAVPASAGAPGEMGPNAGLGLDDPQLDAIDAASSALDELGMQAAAIALDEDDRIFSGREAGTTADDFSDPPEESDEWTAEEVAEEFAPWPDEKIGPECFGSSDGSDFKDDDELGF